MRRWYVTSILSIVCIHLSAALEYTSDNSFAIWGGAGYNNLHNYQSQTSTTGGLGGHIGLGYRFSNAKNGLILQAGAEVHYKSSNMHYDDFQTMENMYDTERRQMEMYFDFSHITEHHKYIPIGISALIGYKSPYSNWYFLVGPKLMHTIFRPITTICTVTTTGIYEGIIGEGNGLLYDMPDHYFTTVERTLTTTYKSSPMGCISAEIGYNFKFPSTTYTSYNLQVAVFFEYGAILKKSNTSATDLLVSTSKTTEYRPQVNSFLWRNVNGCVGNLNTGVKLTFLITKRKKICLGCR